MSMHMPHKVDILREISKRYFDGNIMVGPRRDYIITVLRQMGAKVEVDNFGNVWVKRGSGEHPRVFSSHMDVDRTRGYNDPIADLEEHKRYGTVYKGIVDNSVGCYMNLEAVHWDDSKFTNWYVFTLSEELDPRDDSKFAKSAKYITKTLKREGVKPSMMVAVDVTYPRLLVTEDEFADNLDAEPLNTLVDFFDRKHAYIDGVTRDDAKNIAMNYLDAFKNSNIEFRELSGWDEAEVYSEIAPSFAFGPIAFGDFDRPGQIMPRVNIKTAFDFLRFMTQNPVKL